MICLHMKHETEIISLPFTYLFIILTLAILETTFASN